MKKSINRLLCKLLGHDYRFLTPTHNHHCNRTCELPDSCACIEYPQPSAVDVALRFVAQEKESR